MEAATHPLGISGHPNTTQPPKTTPLSSLIGSFLFQTPGGLLPVTLLLHFTPPPPPPLTDHARPSEEEEGNTRHRRNHTSTRQGRQQSSPSDLDLFQGHRDWGWAWPARTKARPGTNIPYRSVVLLFNTSLSVAGKTPELRGSLSVCRDVILSSRCCIKHVPSQAHALSTLRRATQSVPNGRLRLMSLFYSF